LFRFAADVSRKIEYMFWNNMLLIQSQENPVSKLGQTPSRETRVHSSIRVTEPNLLVPIMPKNAVAY